MARERVTVEILYLEGCPHHEPLLPRLRALIAELDVDARVVLKRVDSARAAEHERFLGSPTVRVNDQDIGPNAATRADYGLKCRLYQSNQALHGDIPDELIRAALNRSSDP